MIMFLSVMIHTGKIDVISAFVYLVKFWSKMFSWVCNNNLIKITALTCTATCLVPNSKKIHN